MAESTDDQRARQFYNSEPYVDRKRTPTPTVDIRVANALEFIAYQLWSINSKMPQVPK